MIGLLRGELAVKSPTAVVLDVGGVGYEVVCPLTVLDNLPPTGGRCTLVIHTHVREDQITLFGFATQDERALFRQLVAVSGIGPRLAVACLSGMTAEALIRALVDGDVKRLSSVPGIGKRTAERMVLELQEKVHPPAGSRAAAGLPAPSPALDDLDSALRNLGYRAKDVESLIDGLRAEAPAMTFEQLLREALKRLNG
ncbi:MAG: Holliday junction branch migration protein RuvA [Myxococcales bacterium]|nr:Holliday junction branch migration protein RuvA [Myxococcales bacterium]